MNNKKVMEIKRIYKQRKCNEKLEEIYYRSTDMISHRFETMVDMMNEILDLSNERLSLEEDTDNRLTKEIYRKHLIFHRYFNKAIKEIVDIRDGKNSTIEGYISSYKDIYFKIIVYKLGKGASKKERSGYITFLIAPEIMKYRNFISDYVKDWMDEFTIYHDEVCNVLPYIFNGTDEEEIEELVEIDEEIEGDDPDIEYIPKVRDLEKMAKDLGYILKSQNGSHKKYQNIQTNQCVTIPFHGGKDIGVGLSKTIQKQLIEGIIA